MKFKCNWVFYYQAARFLFQPPASLGYFLLILPDSAHMRIPWGKAFLTPSPDWTVITASPGIVLLPPEHCLSLTLLSNLQSGHLHSLMKARIDSRLTVFVCDHPIPSLNHKLNPCFSFSEHYPSTNWTLNTTGIKCGLRGL